MAETAEMLSHRIDFEHTLAVGIKEEKGVAALLEQGMGKFAQVVAAHLSPPVLRDYEHLRNYSLHFRSRYRISSFPRSASRFFTGRDAERPGVRFHAERGNEEDVFSLS